MFVWNSPTGIFNSKIFPGMIPPNPPLKRGEGQTGRKEGGGREGGCVMAVWRREERPLWFDVNSHVVAAQRIVKREFARPPTELAIVWRRRKTQLAAKWWKTPPGTKRDGAMRLRRLRSVSIIKDEELDNDQFQLGKPATTLDAIRHWSAVERALERWANTRLGRNSVSDWPITTVSVRFMIFG